jgi:hypothetical protein
MSSDTQRLIDEYAAVGIALHGLRMKSLNANDQELMALNEAMARLLARLLGILQTRFIETLSAEGRRYLEAKLPSELGNMAGGNSDSVLFQTERSQETV